MTIRISKTRFQLNPVKSRRPNTAVGKMIFPAHWNAYAKLEAVSLILVEYVSAT